MTDFLIYINTFGIFIGGFLVGVLYERAVYFVKTGKHLQDVKNEYRGNSEQE